MKQNILEFIKKYSKWLLLLTCLVGFLIIAQNVFNKEIMSADIIGYKFIATILISNGMTPIIKCITNFGGATFLIILTAILIIVIKNRKTSGAILMNLLIATILNQLLKNILKRPRPIEYRLIEESGYSFPSGHSMISMAYYGFFIYLIYKNVQNKYVKWISIIFLSFLIISIGISRIYLGVHYTSDVLAGFLIGIAYLVVYISSIKSL